MQQHPTPTPSICKIQIFDFRKLFFQGNSGGRLSKIGKLFQVDFVKELGKPTQRGSAAVVALVANICCGDGNQNCITHSRLLPLPQGDAEQIHALQVDHQRTRRVHPTELFYPVSGARELSAQRGRRRLLPAAERVLCSQRDANGAANIQGAPTTPFQT